MTTRRQGYTLLELIVVIAVMSVVTGIGVTAFHRITSYWSALQAKSELHRTAETIFTSLRADLASVVAGPLASQPLHGTDATATGDKQFYRINLANDSLDAQVQMQGGQAGRHMSQRVTYLVDRASNANVGNLVRAIGEVSDKAKQSPLAQGVIQFDVQYSADGSTDWVASWDQPTLPAAVRVNLTVTDPDRPMDTIVARKAVFPIHVE